MSVPRVAAPLEAENKMARNKWSSDSEDGDAHPAGGLAKTGTWHWTGLHTNTSLGAKKRPPAADPKNKHPVLVTPVHDAVQNPQRSIQQSSLNPRVVCYSSLIP
jgi:hypothetical protein